jgi:putative endonuclease
MADFSVYILQSERNGRFYIGCSSDFSKRLAVHNAGGVKATRYLRPWKLVYTELHADGTAARKREWALKSLKSRRLLEALIAIAG